MLPLRSYPRGELLCAQLVQFTHLLLVPHDKPFFLQPCTFFVLQPPSHAHPFSSSCTLCLTACVLSLLSQSIRNFPSFIQPLLPAGGARSIYLVPLCVASCALPSSFSSSCVSMLQLKVSSNISLSQFFYQMCSSHLLCCSLTLPVANEIQGGTLKCISMLLIEHSTQV